MLFSLLALQSRAQQIDTLENGKEVYPWSYETEVGLNFTPIVASVIPFNFIEPKAGFTNLTYRRYGRKFGLRINAGIEVDSENDEDNFVLLTIGFEKRKWIAPKVTYSRGLDFGLFAQDEEGGFLLSSFYGIQYHFHKNMFVGTETGIKFIGGSILRINIEAPTSIFLNVRF